MTHRPTTKRPSVHEETAAQVLSHHFGRKPKLLKRLTGGLNNDVFEAQIGRERVIIRLSDDPGKLQVFLKEQWAIRQAHKNKVPTAEVLEVGNDPRGVAYMISEKISGRSGTGGRDRTSLLNALGRYAAIINSIGTKDFGHTFDWSRNKLSRVHTWKEYLDSELRVDERCDMLCDSGILETANVKRLREQVKHIRQWDGKPSLCHGDIRLKNVVVDDGGKIAAILDWEDCTSNMAPYWELSIALHDLTMDEKEMFLEGYGLGLDAFMDMAPAIKALNILNYARVVGIALKQKDKRQLLSLRARLNGSFDLYSL